MRFIVSFEGRRRFVELVFGTPMDMRGLMRWRSSTAERSDPHVRDATEHCRQEYRRAR